MGLNFKDLIVKEEISIKDLKGKVLAIDSMNMLYQFLTTIRSIDGTVLTNSKGKVTSHLIGLFSRTTSLMEQGLKLVFVFDGKPPAIKQKTWEKRTAVKKAAALKFKEAEEIKDIESMRKFAARTAILDKEMITDAKRIITALGLPIVQAPSEGEAQTAFMVKQGDAYASVSQDYDNLIFNCPVLVRNLSITGKRKKAGKFAYQTVKPEMIKLKEVLENLSFSLDQLIVLAILVGTDYNPGGVKGIGPKTGLKLLKEYGDDTQKSPHNDLKVVDKDFSGRPHPKRILPSSGLGRGHFEKIFEEVKWEEHYPDLKWEEIFDTIKNLPVTDKYKLEWKQIDEKKLIKLLVDEFEFSEMRVKSKLEKLRKMKSELSQKGLSSFF